jgi:hypothetical protein
MLAGPVWRSAVVASTIALAVALSPAAAAADGVRFHHYVTDTMRVGSSFSEANGNAFDLDNDGSPENALGGFLAGLSNVFHVDAAIASSIATGDVVLLHTLRAHRFTRDPSAWWRVLDPASAAGTKLPGAITGGRFTGGPGAIPVRLALAQDQPPIELLLATARLQADCTADRCEGKLGGGIPAADVDTAVVPRLAAAMQGVVDASCSISTPSSCSPTATQILAIFDANHDFEVTADELRANFLIQVLLAPDLDLFKASGRRGQDGVNDSLSLGLGFTANSATVRPGL